MRARVVAVGAALVAAVAASSSAQRVAPERPLTLVVGRTAAPSPVDRVDGARRGLSATPLPRGALRVAWRRVVGAPIDAAPLVAEGGAVVVFTARGELLELDADGSERARVAVGAGPLGAGAITSDGTIVVQTGGGDAVGVARHAVRYRTRLGDRALLAGVAPLPLDDGGVVVAGGVGVAGAALGTELAALDAEGRVRARATLPAAVAWPLAATAAGVACVTAEGAVYLWVPGQAPSLGGSFGGAIDGGAAAADGTTLLGVVDGQRLVAVDLARGTSRVLLASTAGGLLGPPSLSDKVAYVVEVTPAAPRVLAIDLGRGATQALALPPSPAPLEADGGVAVGRLPLHTATLVDAAGTVAFGAEDGRVGVVSASGSTELGEVVCGRGAPAGLSSVGSRAPGRAHAAGSGRPSAGFAGIAPAGPDAFVIACESGVVMAIGGDAPR